MTQPRTEADALAPYVSRTALQWLHDAPDEMYRSVDATVVFADVSGFTPLTERLARRGKVGAEELTDVLNNVFQTLGAVTDAYDGDLLKFGGDAMLLLFSGSDHVVRAAAAAHALLVALRPFRRLRTPGGVVSLSMSVGMETGEVQLAHIGRSHRELFALGPTVSMTIAMENAAEGGQILVGPAAAAVLPGDLLGGPVDEGRLLARPPEAPMPGPTWPAGGSLGDRGLEPPLAAHLRSGREDGEHRIASLAFVQFKGTDVLLQREGPEAAAAALHDVVSTAQEACLRQRVTFLATDVDKDGGKILFVAGAPKTGPHDEDRMLLALRESVTCNGVLVVRAGANRGRAFAVDVGSDTRRTYAVMGDATNLAARVMGKAEPGGVVATQALLEHLHGSFAITTLEPFMVKGKSRPVTAGVVGELRGGATESTTGERLPFVGREAELGRLRAAVASARDGHGSTVVIEGEPGLGKSRLVEEMLRSTEGMRRVVIEGGRYAAATPYFALRAPLRALIGADRDSLPAEVAFRLRQALRTYLPESLPWLPLLAPIVGAEVDDTPEVLALDPAFRRTTTDTHAIRLLQTLKDPTLILVEDAHWLDDATAGLLERLALEIRSRPWFVCVTRRPVPDGWVLKDAEATTLRLAPLRDEESAALLRAVGGQRSLSPHARAAVAERGGGNPLFLRELLESVDDAGDIADLPDTLEGLIASGIDELDREDRDTLRVAAVLGGNVAERMLARMLELEERQLHEVLLRLQRFLVVASPGTLRFTHALIRDVAYESLPFRRRRALHALAGRMLMADTADPSGLADLLALHFHAAEQPAETWRFARIAGDRARRNAAPVEAARFYRWALAAARAVPDAPIGDRIAVADALGDVLEVSGLYDDAARAFASARKLATDPVQQAELLKKEGWVRERSGRYSAALTWYTRALKQLPEQRRGETARLHAEVVMSLGVARARQGRLPESVRLLRTAAEEAEALQDRPTLAHVYYVLDWVMTDMGDPDAKRYRELALPIYEELGDLVGQGKVLNNLGIDAYYEGRWDESRGHYERCRDVARRSGSVMVDATALNNLGEILSDQGRLDEAREVFDEALGVCRSIHFPVGQALCVSNLGRVASRAGNYDEAATWFEEARDRFARIGADSFVVEVDSREAERRLFAGDAEGALLRADDTIRHALVLGGIPVAQAMLDRVGGVASAVLGDVHAARARLDASRARATEGDADYELALTLHAIASVTSGPGAEAMSIAAASILDRLGVVDVRAVSAARVLQIVSVPTQRVAVE